MRRLLFTLLIYSFYQVNNLRAGPYLQIQQVRSLDYPYITAELSIAQTLPIKNIDASKIKVYENNWQIKNFSFRKINPKEEPKNLIILIDTSLSLSQKEFEMQIKAAKVLAEGLNSNDSIAAITFNKRVTERCPFTSNFSLFSNCVSKIKREGQKTVLYDAILQAYKLAKSLTKERKAVILFTDGRDDGSSIQPIDLLSIAATANIPLYLASTQKSQDIQNLTRIAQISGGETFITKELDNLQNIFNLMRSLLDNTYVVRYLSNASIDSPDGRSVAMTVQLETIHKGSLLKDQDDYLYRIPLSRLEVWLRKAWLDERYFLFMSGLVLMILLFALILVFARRPVYKTQIKKEASIESKAEEAPITENEITQEKPQAPYIPGTRVEPKQSFSSRYVSNPGSNLQDDIQDIHSAYPPIEQGIAYLMQKSGPETGKKFFLSWPKATIGKDKENSLSLDDNLAADFHAKIEKLGREFYIFDLLSNYGISLNGKKLLRPKSLQDFDEITIGKTQLIFRRILR
jgi:hypothetical protein